MVKFVLKIFIIMVRIGIKGRDQLFVWTFGKLGIYKFKYDFNMP